LASLQLYSSAGLALSSSEKNVNLYSDTAAAVAGRGGLPWSAFIRQSLLFLSSPIQHFLKDNKQQR
jgi:hypothetical protein